MHRASQITSYQSYLLFRETGQTPHFTDLRRRHCSNVSFRFKCFFPILNKNYYKSKYCKIAKFLFLKTAYVDITKSYKAEEKQAASQTTPNANSAYEMQPGMTSNYKL